MKIITSGVVVASLMIGSGTVAQQHTTSASDLEPGRMVDPSTVPGMMQKAKRVFPPTPMPAARGDFIGLSTANGRIAWDFADLAFNQKNFGAAFDKYVSRTDYFNHNSSEASQTFESQRRFEVSDVPPAAQFIFRQVIAQGELVVLHIEAHAGQDVPPDELVLIVRIRKGKIIDHWDFHIPLATGSNTFQRMNR